jgi:hypothetical protein
MAATNYLNPPSITGTANLGVAFSSNQSTQLIYPPTLLSVGGNTAGNTMSLGGSLFLAGGPNVTLSGSTAANAMSLSISAGAGGGGADGVNIIAAGGSTANTTGTIVFSNSNGVSFGLNGATVTASHNGLTSQSNQAFSASGGSTTFQTLNFANSNGFTFSNSNGSVIGSYSVPSTAGLLSAINLSAGTTSNNLSAFTLSNSNGITFGLNGSVITGSHNGLTSQSNQALSGSNGSFTFQTATFGNLNGLSFYSSNGSIVGSHNGITSQSNQQISAFAAGNSTQSSSGTYNASSIVYRGEGIASVGVTNGSVVISVPSGGGAGDGVNILAAGTQTAATTGTVLFSNANGVTFGMSNSSVITASVNAGGGAAAELSFWPDMVNSLGQTSMDKGATANPGGASTNTTVSIYLRPIQLPGNLRVSQNRMIMSYGTAAGTGSFTFAHSAGLYSLNGSSMSLITAWQNVLEVSQNSVTGVSWRSFFGTNSTSNSASAGGNISASLTGNRAVVMGDQNTTSFSAGMYYLAIGCTTQTAAANVVGGLSHAHISEGSAGMWHIVDVGINAATTNRLFPYHGAFSTTRSATNASVRLQNIFPASFNTSIISNSGSASGRHIYFLMANTSR